MAPPAVVPAYGEQMSTVAHVSLSTLPDDAAIARSGPVAERLAEADRAGRAAAEARLALAAPDLVLPALAAGRHPLAIVGRCDPAPRTDDLLTSTDPTRAVASNRSGAVEVVEPILGCQKVAERHLEEGWVLQWSMPVISDRHLLWLAIDLARVLEVDVIAGLVLARHTSIASTRPARHDRLLVSAEGSLRLLLVHEGSAVDVEKGEAVLVPGGASVLALPGDDEVVLSELSIPRQAVASRRERSARAARRRPPGSKSNGSRLDRVWFAAPGGLHAVDGDPHDAQARVLAVAGQALTVPAPAVSCLAALAAGSPGRLDDLVDALGGGSPARSVVDGLAAAGVLTGVEPPGTAS